MEQKILKLIPHVRVPSRYTGMEINVSRKTRSADDVSVALSYPDIYELGMSSLGIRILYGLLNDEKNILCERVFSPAEDMENLLRINKIPLFTIESKRPVKEFDILCLSLSSELNYTNMLNLLALSGIPMLSSERKEEDPLVIAGGNSLFNFSPLTPFIDCFAVGEGEELIIEIIDIFREMRGEKREKILASLSKVDGVYIPAFPKSEVRKRFIKDLDEAYFPVKWLVPLTEIVHDRVSLEIMRGCGQGCFFCQAGKCWRPVRSRSVDRVTEIAEQAYNNTGYEEFSLLSFSSGDHPQIEQIVERLLNNFSSRRVTFSFPSVRIDTFSFELVTREKNLKKSGLTFAPETGESLRERIGKQIKDSELIELLRKARNSGWRQIKLYFMLGLPEESDRDIYEISSLINELSKIISIKASFNTFIPKAHTLFERARFISEEEYFHKKRLIVENVKRNRHIKLTFHPYRMSYVENLLGRGDEKISSVIKKVWDRGGKMENWRDCFNFSLWEEGCKEEGIEIDSYLKEMKEDLLPWSFVKIL